jgi:hypothetical protein
MIKFQSCHRYDFGGKYTKLINNCLPYGIRLLNKEKGLFELFNREYSAITQPFYADFTIEDMYQLRSKHSNSENLVNFYSDSTKPTLDNYHWLDYIKKLKFLALKKCSYKLGAYSYAEELAVQNPEAEYSKKYQLDDMEQERFIDDGKQNPLYSTEILHKKYIFDLLPFGIRSLSIDENIFEMFDRHNRAISTPMLLFVFNSKLNSVSYNQDIDFYRDIPKNLIWLYDVNKPPRTNTVELTKYFNRLKTLVNFDVEFEYGVHSFR